MFNKITFYSSESESGEKGGAASSKNKFQEGKFKIFYASSC